MQYRYFLTLLYSEIILSFMEKSILGYLQDLFESDFSNEFLQEAFDQDENKCLAEVGDSILDLVIRMIEYRKPDATPKSIDNARQKYASKKALQSVLNGDREFTEYLIECHGCTSPPGHIGLERSDDYIEAIIGATFLIKGLKAACDFSKILLNLDYNK